VSEFADQELAEFIAEFNALNLPPARLAGADALRAGTLARVATRPTGPEMDTIRDLTVSPLAVPTRLYRPTADPTGLVVYLHGGGWVIGDLETHDRALRRLAATAGVAVLGVDYRRAPEHPWPAAIDDAEAVMRWVAAGPTELGALSGRVAIAGDSAGGATATLVCLRLRDDGSDKMPDLQVLVYTSPDLAMSGESMDTKGHGYGLPRDDIDWFFSQWVPDRTMRLDGRVSPLRAEDLSGLPPTVLVSCEHDPLRDQGETLAARLHEAGVTVTLRREPGMVHNFLLWDLISPACAAAGDRIAADIAERL
jgi:acetyl esterase